jgi:hypothetical protein
MQKIVSYLLEVSFIALLVKSLIFTPGFSEALVLISLVVSICYKHLYLTKSKIEDRDLIKQELDSFKEDIEIVKNAITSMKLAQNISKPGKLSSVTNEKENVSVRRF